MSLFNKNGKFKGGLDLSAENLKVTQRVDVSKGLTNLVDTYVREHEMCFVEVQASLESYLKFFDQVSKSKYILPQKNGQSS